MKPAPIIFLDFDGVAHPECCTVDLLFTRLPLIEDVLRWHKHVEVVISSSWRGHHTLPELRGYFSDDIAPRVIDCTPLVRQDPCEPAIKGLRQVECLTWLTQNRPEHRWIAIDDVPWIFEVGCPNLLLTNHCTGFSESDARHLHAVLSGAKT